MTRHTIKIDQAGRVVLPMDLRKRFNLISGDRLRVLVDDSGFRLEPAEEGGKLIRKGSVLVFSGEFDEPITSEKVEKMIEEDRDFGGSGGVDNPS